MSPWLFSSPLQIVGHLDIKFLAATKSVSLTTPDITGVKKYLLHLGRSCRSNVFFSLKCYILTSVTDAGPFLWG